MLTSILAALQALPELLKLLNALGVYLREKFGDNPAKFIADTHQAIEGLKNAKTSEEKQAAARAINDLISRL